MMGDKKNQQEKAGPSVWYMGEPEIKYWQEKRSFFSAYTLAQKNPWMV